MKALQFEELKEIAQTAGATKCIFRKSHHSFTGWVTEVWFTNPDIAVAFQAGMEEYINHFIAMRYPNQHQCYLSVPTQPK